MKTSISERLLQFPIKAAVLRRHLIHYDQRCPECGAFALDVGNECQGCGFDAMPEVRDYPKLSPGKRLQNLMDAYLKDLLELPDDEALD